VIAPGILSTEWLAGCLVRFPNGRDKSICGPRQSGQCGTEVMGVDDLIVRLIIEDQGTILAEYNSNGNRANDDCFFVIEEGIGKILAATTSWAIPMPVPYITHAAENALPTH
jgi:hypothetical protein